MNLGQFNIIQIVYGNGNAYTLDELRLGPTYASVTPALPQAVAAAPAAGATPPTPAADPEEAVKAAYKARSDALGKHDADAALAVQSPAFVQADAKGKPQPADARKALTALLQNAAVRDTTTVDDVTPDDTGLTATANAHDRLIVQKDAGGPGTETNSVVRDFWTFKNSKWLLTRRRVLSADAAPVSAAAASAPAPDDDPVFGPNAPQPVVRYTFGAAEPAALPLMYETDARTHRRAERTLAPSLTPQGYAHAFYDICREIGLQAKLSDTHVFVTAPGGVLLGGHSPAAFQIDTIRP